MSVVQWHPHHHVVREPQYTTASGIKTHPRSLTQRRMASRSIKHGPPDMSCMMTRAGLNGTSPAAPVGCGDQFKMVCTSVVVTLSPSQFRTFAPFHGRNLYAPRTTSFANLKMHLRLFCPPRIGRSELFPSSARCSSHRFLAFFFTSFSYFLAACSSLFA